MGRNMNTPTNGKELSTQNKPTLMNNDFHKRRFRGGCRAAGSHIHLLPLADGFSTQFQSSQTAIGVESSCRARPARSPGEARGDGEARREEGESPFIHERRGVGGEVTPRGVQLCGAWRSPWSTGQWVGICFPGGGATPAGEGGSCCCSSSWRVRSSLQCHYTGPLRVCWLPPQDLEEPILSRKAWMEPQAVPTLCGLVGRSAVRALLACGTSWCAPHCWLGGAGAWRRP